MGHRRAGAGHQGLVGDRVEGRGVGGPHLVAGQDGAHEAACACSATTKAMATPVGVGQREVELARALGAGQLGGGAVQHEDRGRCGWRPSRVVRRTSTSVSAKPPMPVPSAFMTASLAAKRAARLWAASAEPVASDCSDAVKQRAAKRGAAVEHAAEPRHVDRVDPDADDRAHSTVTVLARLRGRSGSCPCRRASR